MEELRLAITPYYLYVKAVHVLAAMVWAFSTAVAWAFYLRPAFKAALRDPDDTVAIERRNFLMERFDRGAAVEHVAFPVLVVTALLLLWMGRVDLTQWNAITAKLWIGVLVIIPMECVDYYLSHFGGNKASIRRSGDAERYERFMAYHWRFFQVTEPLVVVIVPLMVFLAVARPF
ncbi:MAG: hypothetical protein MJE66_20210 [Proteobacteria bacterium]|nr:hypothetical protein [Pseudomonadota bacterium]